MPKFLYSAVDRNGKTVIQKIEAENLPQARGRLNFQGFSEIAFFESELNDDVQSLFGEQSANKFDKHLQLQVELQYDTRLRRTFITILKKTWFYLPLLAFFVYIQSAAFALFWFVLMAALVVYAGLPGVLYHLLVIASCWGNTKKVRLLGGAIKLLQPIFINKIPLVEVDTHLACADAREGKLVDGLGRIQKYQFDPLVSPRVFRLEMARVYNHGRDYDSVLRLYESGFDEDDVKTEEMLDYALCLAVRKRDTSRARQFVNRLLDTEMSVINRLFIPYLQGVIEVEDGNFERGEFYLREASKQLAPFKHNEYLVGLKSGVKAFLAIALRRRGNPDEARRLFGEAKPFLTSVRDTEILNRCEAELS